MNPLSAAFPLQCGQQNFVLEVWVGSWSFPSPLPGSLSQMEAPKGQSLCPNNQTGAAKARACLPTGLGDSHWVRLYTCHPTGSILRIKLYLSHQTWGCILMTYLPPPACLPTRVPGHEDSLLWFFTSLSLSFLMCKMDSQCS